MQFITLNHPVDCGICDKAGECTLQDYHYEHNGERSISRDVKVHATKFYDLSDRIMLDNERCILCTRCVRFTHEVSKSTALGVIDRGDHSLIRPAEDGAFDTTPTPTTSSTSARSARCCRATSCTRRASGT
jgi:NADH-quinone oxidoreductase subunit G